MSEIDVLREERNKYALRVADRNSEIRILRSELAAAKADLERARLALDACKDAHFAAQSQHEERAYALATATARIAELERDKTSLADAFMGLRQTYGLVLAFAREVFGVLERGEDGHEMTVPKRTVDLLRCKDAIPTADDVLADATPRAALAPNAPPPHRLTDAELLGDPALVVSFPARPMPALTQGQRMQTSIAEHRSRLRVLFNENEARPLPDSALRSALLDADRLADEHLSLARVPSGSDLERARALHEVLADCANGTAAHKDCIPPEVGHIAAAMARAREEERERCAVEVTRDLLAPLHVIAHRIRASASQASPASSGQEVAHGSESEVRGAERDDVSGQRRVDHAVAAVRHQHPGGPAVREGDAERQGGDVRGQPPGSGAVQAGQGVLPRLHGSDVAICRYCGQRCGRVNQSGRDPCVLPAAAAPAAAQEPEQGEARGRELRFRRCIHEVCGLSDEISEDPTAIEVGQAPDGSWVAWHEDYPGDGSVRLTGGVLAEIARAQEAPADAAPPAQAEPDALREAREALREAFLFISGKAPLSEPVLKQIDRASALIDRALAPPATRKGE